MRLADQVRVLDIERRGTLDADDVGRPFVSVGYGLQVLQDPTAPSADPPFGTRRAGVIRLRALGGKVFELEHGSFQGFVDAMLAGNAQALEDMLTLASETRAHWRMGAKRK